MAQPPFNTYGTAGPFIPYQIHQFDAAGMLETPNFPAPGSVPLDRGLLAAHVRFASALRERDNSSLRKSLAQVEFETVMRLFPAEESKGTRLALAAWLSYKLALQDAVESMTRKGPPARVRHDLSEAWKLFDERQDVSLKNGRGATSHIDQSSNHICHLSNLLQKHLRSLLSAQVVLVTFRHVRDMLMGLVEESLFRETQTWDIDNYLSIRTRTVGIRPWFAMLMIPDASVPMSEADALMTTLKTWVISAIGLQIDIIGLARGLERQETMNFIIVLRNQVSCARVSPDPGVISYEKEIQTAIRYQNEAFHWAAGCFDSISRYGSRMEKCQAGKVFHLLSTHKTWAVEVGQYEKSQPSDSIFNSKGCS
jgi:hypothetical protein